MRSDTEATWAILDGYGYEVVEVVRETAATVFYKGWNNAKTEWRERKTTSALPWRGSEEEARRISAQLITASGERNRRVREANVWFNKRVAELIERRVLMAEDAEIVEAVRKALQSTGSPGDFASWDELSRAARPLIERAARKEALEDAARVAEEYDSSFDTLGDRSISWDYVDGQDAGREAAAQDIAQAIRALDERRAS